MVAIDFPVPAAIGEEFPAAGIVYVWNGQVWTVKPATGGGGGVDAYTKTESDARYPSKTDAAIDFVNVVGDRMTGALLVDDFNPTSTPAPKQILTDIGSFGTGVGFNAYIDSGGAVWRAKVTGRVGVLNYNKVNGALGVWTTPADVTAGAAGTATHLMNFKLDSGGTLPVIQGVLGSALRIHLGAGEHVAASFTPGVTNFVNTVSSVSTLSLNAGGSTMSNNNAAGIVFSVNHLSNGHAISGTAAQMNYAGGLFYVAGHLGSCAYNYGGVNYSYYGSGNAYIGAGSWSGSDARLKSISSEPAFPDGALAAVNAVAVRKYTPAHQNGPWSTGPKGMSPVFGWVAQEVEPVIPAAVADLMLPTEDLMTRAAFLNREVPADSKSDEANSIREATGLSVKAINDRFMLATLWAAVQELSAEVEALKAAGATATKGT